MAVRFLCPSCSQPLEVDDDLALKVVACPYCRKTITAPAASTFVDPPQVPVAAPMRGGPGAAPYGPSGARTPGGEGQERYSRPGSTYDSGGPNSAGRAGPLVADHAAGLYASFSAPSNRLAVVAFVLACAVVFLSILSGVVLSQHRIEFDELVKSWTDAGGGVSGQWKAMSDFVEQRGGVLPQWLFILALLNMAALGTWVAALICAIIALRRPVRRGFAMAALIICSIYLLLNCAGAFAG